MTTNLKGYVEYFLQNTSYGHTQDRRLESDRTMCSKTHPNVVPSNGDDREGISQTFDCVEVIGENSVLIAKRGNVRSLRRENKNDNWSSPR
ncbi:hypothetical protein TNCV_218291 [Trichonephila clavipes]|nr:hypothetical protein TNCV_218291 [Trichonephila clavipes]